MDEKNRKRLTEQEYQRLRRTWEGGKWLGVLIVAFLAILLFMARFFGGASLVLIALGVFVVIFLAGSFWFFSRWKCPKCREQLPWPGRHGDLYLFAKRSEYTNERALPYRCPGCGADIDLVAVVHSDEAPHC